MSEYITVLIEYEDGDLQPSFYAGMEVLGGKVAGVQFNDAFAEIQDLEVLVVKGKTE